MSKKQASNSQRRTPISNKVLNDLTKRFNLYLLKRKLKYCKTATQLSGE